MDPLDAADALPQDDGSDTSTPTDSGLPRSKDECSDDDDTTNSGEDGGEFIPPTQQGSEGGHGLIFTEEQDFTHATQDADHGSRPRHTSGKVYDRRRDRRSSQQDYGEMREGLEAISTRPPRRDDTLHTQFDSTSISSYPPYQHGLYGGIFDYDSSIYGTQSGSQSIPLHSESSYGESSSTHAYPYYDSSIPDNPYPYDTSVYMPQMTVVHYIHDPAAYAGYIRQYNDTYREYMTFSQYRQYLYQHCQINLVSADDNMPYDQARQSMWN